MDKREDQLGKFPAVLQSAFRKWGIAFPKETKWRYEPIIAFRMVSREVGDDRSVSRTDFQSHAEMGQRPRRGQGTKEQLERDPQYYGVSLYTDRAQLKNALKLPRPRKRVAKGYVVESCGPQHANMETSHICWWIYEDANINEGKFCLENENESGIF